jgi:linoleate 10R-lipoxygenase
VDLWRVSNTADRRKLFAQNLPSLTRGPDGSFKDADIANYLLNATESAASAFKARGIPSVLRVIEILGIEQGRAWGACSLNEFRKFIGLRREVPSDDDRPNS